ncbi:hypothetical protein BV331_05645 [Pseudomonas syringae pv. actinidiae]|nr:hypothetical protein BV331_05645 [Pseudomonas syringae pv. actinidiae]
MVLNIVVKFIMGKSYMDYEISEDNISIFFIRLGEGGNFNLVVYIKSY